MAVRGMLHTPLRMAVGTSTTTPRGGAAVAAAAHGSSSPPRRGADALRAVSRPPLKGGAAGAPAAAAVRPQVHTIGPAGSIRSRSSQPMASGAAPAHPLHRAAASISPTRRDKYVSQLRGGGGAKRPTGGLWGPPRTHYWAAWNSQATAAAAEGGLARGRPAAQPKLRASQVVIGGPDAAQRRLAPPSTAPCAPPRSPLTGLQPTLSRESMSPRLAAATVAAAPAAIRNDSPAAGRAAPAQPSSGDISPALSLTMSSSPDLQAAMKLHVGGRLRPTKAQRVTVVKPLPPAAPPLPSRPHTMQAGGCPPAAVGPLVVAPAAPPGAVYAYVS